VESSQPAQNPARIAQPVGVVGLGAMGGAIAERLLDRGVAVAVYDTRPEAATALAERGAARCDSAADLAGQAPTVLLSLPDGAAVRAAVDELAEGAAVRTIVDLSTSGPAAAAAAEDRARAAGKSYVDAPVSGGPRGARSGTLTVMAGGAETDLDAVTPLLELIGRQVTVVGPRPGDGQFAKVINNLLSASAILVTAEALALGVKAGLRADRLLAVVNASSGRSTASADKFPKHVLTRTFDFGFRLDLMTKDVTLCIDEAHRLGVPMPAGSLVRTLWQLAQNSLPAGADCTSMARMVEGWSGVTLDEG